MKRILQVALGFVYLVLLLLSLLVTLKPGASIFYRKLPIQAQDLTREGSAYEYRVRLNPLIYDPSTLLVREDQKVLEVADPGYSSSGVKGTFALKEMNGDQASVLFVPTDLSDPKVNGYAYSVYFRPYIVSSSFVRISLLVLALGVVAFVGYSIVDGRKRVVLLGSPLGMVRLWFSLLDWIGAKIRSFVMTRKSYIKVAVVNTSLLAFLYVLMEWLFLVTKPSFMDILSLGGKVEILLVSGFAAAFLTTLIAIPCLIGVDIVFTLVVPSVRKYVYHLPAAFLAVCLILILVDNFTYTLIGYGVVTSEIPMRIFYALSFVGLFVYISRKMAIAKKPTLTQYLPRVGSIAATTVFASSSILAIVAFRPDMNGLSAPAGNSNVGNKPNIILFGTDGLNAANMSVYGYERDTTPFIQELARTSLVSAYNFTNAASSMGSDTSILTGKLPLTTHVIYPPNTLKGEDMYQHLPGLLQRDGYRTISLGVPYQVDVNTINFQNAFDAVNCEENTTNQLSSMFSGWGYDDEIYLGNDIEHRIEDRLAHIFFVRDMQNPHALVTEAKLAGESDQAKMECLTSYLDESLQTGQPLFAHIHMMGTHGPKFSTTIQKYSLGKSQDQAWMTDFYDDSILNYDNEVQQLVEHLKNNGQYENTILVLYTDHGQQWTSTKNLPLIIHFPGDQHVGTIPENTQNLDIAPTILDYLGIQKPTWVEGSSLLGKRDNNQLIFAVDSLVTETVSGKPALVEGAPFQFKELTIIQCQNLFTFKLLDSSITKTEVADYQNPCSQDSLDSDDVIREKVIDILKEHGYDLPPN